MKTWHYLYFPSQMVAARVANRLQSTGAAVEVRESPPNWLVRVEQVLPRDQLVLEQEAAELEQVAIEEGGEYDGWERELENRSANGGVA